jgi:hypothetical protein
VPFLDGATFALADIDFLRVGALAVLLLLLLLRLALRVALARAGR